VDFTLPEDLRHYLAELDEFIEHEIGPLEEQDDNIRFFDHRREDARTDWDRGGLPSREWEELLAEARRRADAAGHYRYAFPRSYGGRDGTNLGMAVIREHLASKGRFGRGLEVVQHFFNENRIRQAASSLGAARFCIDRSAQYAKTRAWPGCRHT
jgi:alkylation response protein AidB-like acyl-CoA dehydrogenase